MLTEHDSKYELFDFNPLTRAPALSGGSRSGFRPTGLVEGATGLPVGLHKPPQYFSLKVRNSYEQVAGQVYFTMVAMEKEFDRVAAGREFSGETLAP